MSTARDLIARRDGANLPQGFRWKPQRSSDGSGAAGFTLLDALAAMVILSLVMMLVPKAITTARQGQDRSQELFDARLAAQAVLQRELPGHVLRPGVYGGTIADHAWRAVLTQNPSFDAAQRRQDGPRHAIFDVHLTLATSGAPLELDTLLIGVLP